MAVEAKSLASLNILAANPPHHPGQDQGGRSYPAQEPLTLYISRVPGTRDVILSPFKPQQRNVTAEDIACSLYYVHLELPNIAPSPFHNGESVSPHTHPSLESNGGQTQHPFGAHVDRNTEFVNNPLAKPDSKQHVLATPPTSNHIQPTFDGSHIKRKPVPGQAAAPPLQQFSQPSPSPSPSINSNGSFSHPLPPLPSQDPQPRPPPPYSLVNNSPYPTAPPQPRSHNSQTLQSPHVNENRLSPNTRHVKSFSADGMLTPPASASSPRTSFTDRSSHDMKKPSTTSFTLTLIRRDPSSSHQWNVARISSHELGKVHHNSQGLSSSSPNEHVVDPSSATAVHAYIHNPGYAKFVSPRLSANGFSPNPLNHPQTLPVPYHCAVSVAHGKRWTSNFRKMFRRSNTGDDHHGQPRQSTVIKYNNQHGSRNSPPVSPTPTSSSSDLKVKGYEFLSPWGTRCEMRIGDMGSKTLHCHHYPHNEVADSEGHDNIFKKHVSELRFDMPSESVNLQGKPRTSFRHSFHHQQQQDVRQGHLRVIGGMGTDDADGDGDDDGPISPFDLNLGRERAGGGHSGRKAKLGKLIVYDEGQMMLDLVVGVNVGLWWASWDM